MNRAPTAEPPAQGTKYERFLIANKWRLILASFLVPFLITVAILPTSSRPQTRHNSRMQTTRELGQCLYSYALDHDGKYPAGKSSTDIFQQLIDQQYINDPEFLYFEMPGKIKATSNKLKPENVCFDITNPIQSDDPDSLPLVFSTGYKIDYVPGGKAHPLTNDDLGGIAVFFKDNNVAFLRAQPDGIPLFPPAGAFFDKMPAFDPKGRIYKQLTPDGLLP